MTSWQAIFMAAGFVLGISPNGYTLAQTIAPLAQGTPESIRSGNGTDDTWQDRPQ